MSASWLVFRGAFANQLKVILIRQFFRLVMITNPILIATTLYMIYRYTHPSESFATLIVIGSGMFTIWMGIVFTTGAEIDRERYIGTLTVLFGSPSSLRIVVLAKTLANGMLSIVGLLISVVYSYVVLGVSIEILHPPEFVVALLAFTLSASMFALSLSCLYLLSNSAPIMQNFSDYPYLLISGVFFPLEVLPAWLQTVGRIVPLSWGTQAMYWAVDGRGDVQSFWTAIAAELVLAAAYCVASLLLFRVMERRVRILANLDVF